MDTKERTRRASPPAKGRTARRRSAGTQSRNSTRDQRKRSTARNRSRPQQQRTVRAPREEIPEVVYTMPKPLRRGTFLLKLVSVVAVVMALMLVMSVFFKVETVTVSGAEKYSAWMVMEASGIRQGDSLLGISKAQAAGRIQSQLPYVEKVKIGRKLPGTVMIEIKELEVTYAIQANDTSWWLIASSGRVIEQIDSAAATGYTRILGVLADGPRKDQTVTAAKQTLQTEATEETAESGLTVPTQFVTTDADRLAVALEILQCLEESEVIGTIASIDVTDLTDITMEYGQRFHVVLGDSERLSYKISYMAQAISQLDEYEIGELDVSFAYSDQALLTQEE